jgi:predicted transposase YdaD
MEMDFKQLGQAIKLIAEEKNLPEEQVQDVVQQPPHGGAIMVIVSKKCE